MKMTLTQINKKKILNKKPLKKKTLQKTLQKTLKKILKKTLMI